jgi:filamentous hemagglutinin family protein
VSGGRKHEVVRVASSWWRRVVTVVVSVLMVAAGALLTAAPAAAVTAGSGPLLSGVATVAGTVTAVTGGTATYDNTTPGTTTIAVSGPRTIIDFAGLNLAATDTLAFTMNDATDIVVLRVATGTASIGGRLQSVVGSGFGGNVWPFAAAGVIFPGTAQVDVGGLLASSGAIADADFLDEDPNFSLTGANGSVIAQSSNGLAPYPAVRGHGSLVAFVGSSVFGGPRAQIGAAPGTRTEVLFGSAREASLTLAPRADGMDVLGFQPAGSPTHGATVHGPVTAADVFLASRPAGVFNTYTTLLGTATANGAVASGDGDVVVAAGGRLIRPSATDPMQPVLEDPAPDSISGPSGVVTAAGRLVFAASDDLVVSHGAQLSAPTVALRSGDRFANLEGSSTVASATGQWVVYAPRPEDVEHPSASTQGTLDSGRTAIWGEDLDTLPPSSIPGNRYVFSDPPDITVTAHDKAKNYDDAVLAGQPTELTATVAGALHPGISGVFLGDTGTVWTGAPDLTSDGAPATAPERPGDYPIVPSLGTLASPLGYDFVFVDGTLDVDDTTPPTVTPNPTGTLGDNGWYTGDAGLTWSITDPGTIASSVTGAGCGPVSVTTDQATTDYTCTGTSLGGSAAPVTVSIGRDATRPTLTAGSSIGGIAHLEGAWTNTDVRVDYLCSDATSGVAPGSPSPNVDPVTATQTLTGTCTDNAGNTATVQHQVNIDRVLPTVTDETLQLAGTGAAYVPGTWTNQDVELTWACTDEGGSGVADGSRSATATSSGTLQGACRDGAGNERNGQAFAVSIDTLDPAFVDLELTTGPVGGTSTSYEPGTWSRYPVQLNYGCSDEGGSGAAGAGPFGETLQQSGTLTATCTDAAGNEITRSFDVDIDDQAPTIGDLQLTTADGTVYTSGDWTTQAVTLSWTCTDVTGGSGAMMGADSVVATGTGPLRAVCADAAGNSVSSEAFQANIDTAAPTLADVPANQSLTTTGATATATWTGPTATDDQDTDVPVTCAPASGSSFPVGATTVTCTATDHAGNTASGSFQVTVTQPPATATFDKPIDKAPVMNIAKLGRVIAVKSTVTVGGAAVSGPSAQPVYLGVSSGISCSVSSTTDPIEDYAAGSSASGNLMQWDAAAQRWTFRVDTGAFAMKPNGCYRVSVYYGGTVTGDRATGGVLAGSFYVQTKK